MAEEPNWDALPHDPQAFFELPTGFDRRDLKRSYSRLIRVYKPERHPEEFQRIRAAYEQLDRELRYGRSAETAKPQAQRWDETAETTDGEVSEQKPKERRSVPEQLIDRVLSESPQSIYDEISGRADKSPYDFYCLAILSDLLNPRKTLRFTRWLVKGIEAHPFEPNLLYLLREDLTLTVTEADLPNMLEACAVAVPRDQFYALTEPAWERLLRTIPFTEFVTLLESCERHLRDISISYRVTFIMRVLRHAVWSGQREWVDEAFAFVEQNFQEIPPALENEIELLATVDEYATLREQFLDGNPLREQMDNALRQYMTQEAAVGDQAVIDAQVGLLTNPELALEAFPYEATEAVASFYSVWAWAATDIGERYGPERDTLNVDLWQRSTKQLVLECSTESSKSTRSRLHSVIQLAVFLPSPALVFFGSFFAAMLLLNNFKDAIEDRYPAFVWQLVIVTAVGFAAAITWFAFQRILNNWWNPYTMRISKIHYSEIWRSRVLKFLVGSNMSFGQLTYFMNEVSRAEGGGEIYPIVLLQDDYGLAIYSLALPLAT